MTHPSGLGIAVFSGADEWRSADSLRDALAGVPMEQVRRFDGATCDFTSVEDTLRSYSLFGDESVVVIDQADQLGKADLSRLPQALDARASTTRALVRFGPTGKQLPTFPKGTAHHTFAVLDERTVGPFLQAQAAKHGVVLTPEAMTTLVTRLGPANSGGLAQEIAKFASLGPGPVTADMVKTHTAQQREGNRWAMHDAILGRDPKSALLQMGRLRSDPSNKPVGELTMLAGAVADLATAVTHRAHHLPMPEKVRRAAITNASQWSAEEVDTFLDSLADLDRRMKGQQGGIDDEWRGLQSAIVRHVPPVTPSVIPAQPAPARPSPSPSAPRL
jgi:DNA polymerase III delta subunit